MKRFRIQVTLVWYEPYEESEFEYYESEEDYANSTIESIKESGIPGMMNNWVLVESNDMIVEIEDVD